MSFHRNEDRIEHILKQCFPKADEFRIIENSTNNGNAHYTSDIVHLTFEFEEDGIPSRKSLVLKVPKNNDSASYLNQFQFFATEKFVYNFVIPRMNHYLDESLAPLHFKAADSSIIILENLLVHGYEAGEMNRQLYSLSQCLPILKALAHFHATSHKIAEMEPQLLQNEVLQNSIQLELKKKALGFWEPIYGEILAQNNASHLIPELKQVFLYPEEHCDKLKSKFDYSNFKFHVLIHGDFRKDNILLKYNSNNAVDGVKFIDFQTCFWSSPVFDFMYFVTISAQAEVLENHFETLVQWYIECLNGKLTAMNCTQLYGRENFMEDIKNLRICTILNVTMSSFIMYPLDRYELLDSLLKGKEENMACYAKASISDEALKRTFLSNIKLFEKLRLFEP